MGVLPMGTFNFFARGLGLSEVPEEAARQLLDARPHRIRVGTVNGRAFLNNASIGIYPAILKERETVYSRWGRFRLAAHWSVLKVFLRFRKPMKLTIETDAGTETRRTPLVFAARSAYQLDSFGLDGAEAIDRDRFAVLIARASGRRALLAMTLRLALRAPKRGRDYDLIATRSLVVTTRRARTLVAFDGEKARLPGPAGTGAARTPSRAPWRCWATARTGSNGPPASQSRPPSTAHWPIARSSSWRRAATER